MRLAPVTRVLVPSALCAALALTTVGTAAALEAPTSGAPAASSAASTPAQDATQDIVRANTVDDFLASLQSSLNDLAAPSQADADAVVADVNAAVADLLSKINTSLADVNLPSSTATPTVGDAPAETSVPALPAVPSVTVPSVP
ncbi:hypothetical protein [Streptomyces sp. NPDC048057]|uniref:hypothetical protein n=1 Tax=Streptomyces sp. NPDC048057 TaxID=3155628 RepID=UPI0033CA861B